MKGLASWVSMVFVAVCVCALGIGVYDLTVRQPRTPRLALIDIAKLYAAANQALKSRAIESADAVPGAASPGVMSPALRAAGDFGPQLELVLKEMAGECHCAIVAMATVVGADSTVPDFTPEAARRMGLVLRGSAGQ